VCVCAPCSIMDKMELVFADADLVPLLVQENYVNYSPDLTRDMGPQGVGSTAV